MFNLMMIGWQIINLPNYVIKLKYQVKITFLKKCFAHNFLSTASLNNNS